MKHLAIALGLFFLIQIKAMDDGIVYEVGASETTSFYKPHSILPGISTNLTQADIDSLPQADKQKLLALRNYTYGYPTREIGCCGYGNVVVTEQERVDLKNIASRNKLRVETDFRYDGCLRYCGRGVSAVALVGGFLTMFGATIIGMLNPIPMKAFYIYVGATGGLTACAGCLTGCAECSSCSFKGCCSDDAHTVISITK